MDDEELSQLYDEEAKKIAIADLIEEYGENFILMENE